MDQLRALQSGQALVSCIHLFGPSSIVRQRQNSTASHPSDRNVQTRRPTTTHPRLCTGRRAVVRCRPNCGPATFSRDSLHASLNSLKVRQRAPDDNAVVGDPLPGLLAPSFRRWPSHAHSSSCGPNTEISCKGRAPSGHARTLSAASLCWAAREFTLDRPSAAAPASEPA